MGLDMYLSAKRFFWIKDYDTKMQDETAELIKSRFPEMKGKRVEYVIFEMGYWRKANQIHKWFVENVQDGTDNCSRYYVSRDKLKELLGLCKQIMKIAKINQVKDSRIIGNSEEIANILPTQEGFFFGDTQYDEWYISDIENTIKIIEDALALPEGWNFEYMSSW